VDFDANGVAIEPKKPPGSGIPGAPSRVGHNDIAATASVPSWPLIAAASFDRQGVLASWRRDLYETFVLIGLALIGIGGLVWFGVRTANREDEAKRAYQKANEIANAALLSRDLLMKEVHHRVKNSLLMTASLIYLQEKRFEDPHMREAFESTRQRLTSIGLVHEALYSGSSLEAVAIGAYLRRLLDDIGQALGADDRGVVLYLEAEALLLPAHQVTPVGLIVAEVVTNAFKHAFGPNGAGTINVRVGLSNTNEVKVEVSDNGRGYVGSASDSSSGLGTRLIRSLTSQLGGVTSMTNESGATFRLCFPCEARTAPET
jgi:two-component sensor histidine kinase